LSTQSGSETGTTTESARPIRIFFLLDSFMIGGTETQAVELARRLDPSRYQVTIGCLRREGPLLERLKNTSVEIMEVNLGGGIDSPSGLLRIVKLARYLRRNKVQILHAHDLWSNIVGMSAAMLARTAVTITSQRDLSHDAWYGTYKRKVLRFCQGRSSLLLTNAKAIREGLIERDHLPPDKVYVIYNGVDLDRFRVPPDRDQIFPASAGNKLIVLVGNMITDVKGHRVLIAAAQEVVKAHPKTQFVLVGEGARRPDFETQARDLGLESNFLFLGRRSDVPAILACCDIAVLPSLAEGLPNAVLEYLAAGLPVVATALGGNLEIIQDGKTGLLVPPQDQQALSAALIKLLNEDNLTAQIAAAGHDYVKQNFSFERLVAGMEQLYAKLLKASN
jgi:glycosyltransferase involved in cell wall biosynthesis